MSIRRSPRKRVREASSSSSSSSSSAAPATPVPAVGAENDTPPHTNKTKKIKREQKSPSSARKQQLVREGEDRAARVLRILEECNSSKKRASMRHATPSSSSSSSITTVDPTTGAVVLSSSSSAVAASPAMSQFYAEQKLRIERDAARDELARLTQAFEEYRVRSEGELRHAEAHTAEVMRNKTAVEKTLATLNKMNDELKAEISELAAALAAASSTTTTTASSYSAPGASSSSSASADKCDSAVKKQTQKRKALNPMGWSYSSSEELDEDEQEEVSRSTSRAASAAEEEEEEDEDEEEELEATAEELRVMLRATEANYKMLHGNFTSLERKLAASEQEWKEKLERDVELERRRIRELEVLLQAREVSESMLTKHQEDIELLRATQSELRVAKAEVSTLSEQVKDRVRLQQLVNDLAAKASLLDDERAEHAKLQVKHSVLAQTHAEWTSHFDKLLGAEHVSLLTVQSAFRELQTAAQSLKSELGLLRAQLTEATDASLKHESELQAAQQAKDVAQKSREDREADVKRLSREVEFVTWQREELKKMIAQYDNMPDLKQQSSSSSQASQPQGEEDMSAFYQYPDKEQQARQPQQAQQPGGEDATTTAATVALNKRVAELQHRLEHKEKEVEDLQAATARLEAEVSRLEAARSALAERLGSGEFNPATTRVLHLKLNPESAALKARVQQLLAENKQLSEASAAAAASSGDGGDDSHNVRELRSALAQMEAKYNDADLSMKRLSEVFRVRIQEFREACYRLTGYKVSGNGNRYRLRSMYAERSEDQIVFQKNENDALQVMETDFVKSLDTHVTNALTKSKSIPLFLATVTMDLFEKQTIVA